MLTRTRGRRRAEVALWRATKAGDAEGRQRASLVRYAVPTKSLVPFRRRRKGSKLRGSAWKMVCLRGFPARRDVYAAVLTNSVAAVTRD